jgi:hypothetical protein
MDGHKVVKVPKGGGIGDFYPVSGYGVRIDLPKQIDPLS